MTSRVIVITGASEGIGAQLAKDLASRGDRVALAARSAGKLNQVAGECGNGALAVVTDVTDQAAVNHLRDEVLRAYGQVDVWINNAGRGITREVLDLTDDDFDAMMAVNVKSALYGMQAIVPYFQQRGQGHLINVSSILGRIPFASFRSAYNAAKAALNSLTANLRMNLHAQYPGIHVSLVMPGGVTTGFANNALHGGSRPAGFRPIASAQSTEEVSKVIVDLIDHPRAEVYTNPVVQLDLVRRYYAGVADFEEDMFK
jgi:short-subunit dehydrogenase